MNDTAKQPGSDREEPEVYAVKKIEGRWSLGRRDILRAGGLGAAAALGIESAAARAGAAGKNVVFAHLDNINTLALRGDKLVSGSSDGRIKLWSSPDCRLLGSTLLQGSVMATAWDPKGRFIATGDGTKSVTISSPDVTAKYGSQTLSDAADAIAVSADGKYIAAMAGSDVTIFSTAGFKDGNLPSLSDIKLPAKIEAAAFAENAQLWCACDDGTVRVFASGDASIQIKELQAEKPDSSNHLICGCAFNKALNFVATASSAGRVQLWDVAKLKILRQFAAHDGLINAVAVAPAGDLLACAGSDHDVSVWSLSRSQRLFLLKGHAGPVRAAVFTPDGKYLYTAGNDKSIIQWNLKSGTVAARLIDLSASPHDAKGMQFESHTGQTTTSFTQPCGTPIPPGAVCTCNCVPGSWSAPAPAAPSGGTYTYSYHYWHPN